MGRERPRVALWVCGARDDDAAAMLQLRTGVVGYLAAAGYAEMFQRAGFARQVELARSRPHPRELLAAISPTI